MKPSQVHIIINPFSSGGKTARRQDRIVQQISERLSGQPSLHVTSKPLDAIHSTRTAIQTGAELILVVGGDGTVHEVVNGFASGRSSVNSVCRLGIIGSGTAQDVVRSFDLPKRTEDQIDVACGPADRLVDLGKVSYIDPEGNESEQLFLNECQQGIAAVVVQRFQAHHKWMGGFLGFGLTAISTAARHREQVVAVEIDGVHTVTDSFLGIVVSNGGFAGGGMHFAPRAKVDDGLLDVVLLHKQRVPSRLINFPRIYLGTHVDLSWVSCYKARTVKLTSEEKVPIEADGEFLGYLPCSINVLPRALRLQSRPWNQLP